MLKLQSVFVVCLAAMKMMSSLCATGSREWDIEMVKYGQNGANIYLNKTDLACSNEIDCAKMYARIRVRRYESIDQFFDVSSVMSPRVQMIVDTEQRELLHILDPLVVDSNTCRCLTNHTFQWIQIDKQELSSRNGCLPLSLVCDKIYLAAMQFVENMTSVTIIVEASTIGPFIPRKSITFYNNEIQGSRYSLVEVFHANNLTNIPEDVVDFSIIPENTKLWSLSLGNHILVSSNEFETFRFGKLASEVIKDMPVICDGWKDDISSVLNLPDRILISSKYGLIEQLDPAVNNASQPVVLLQRCIRSLKTVTQPILTNYLVVALEDGHNASYFGTVNAGERLKLQQPLNSYNQTICQAFDNSGSSNCEIISATCTRSRPGKIMFLLRLNDYLLIEFSVRSKEFVLIHDFSTKILHEDAAFNNETYVIFQLSYTQLHQDHLFIFGTALLYSPNAGKEILKISYLENDMIKLFASSHNGDIAFVTSTGQLLVGKIGSPDLRRLHPINGEKVLSYFFDSSGNLFKLVVTKDHQNISTGIRRSRVPLRQAIHTQNLALSLLNSQRFYPLRLQGECNTSCTHQSTHEKPERFCPFARTFLHSFGYQLYSRRSLSLFCLDRLSSKFASPLSEVASHSYEVEHIKAGSSYLDTCLWTSTSYDSHRLQKSISLGRSSCYNFQLDIYLDIQEHADFYSHNFTMDDLRMSVTISNPEYLRVEINRSNNFAEDCVEYNVKICDSGKKRHQNPPGIGQEIVTAEIKIPGAGMNCIAKSFQEIDDIQGYFTTEVQLGCPKLQKVLFDSQSSRAKGGNHYCNEDDPGIPCFHFDRVFYPVFRLYDEATLKNEEFVGNYTLVVVGGASKLASITQFPVEDQARYNYIPGSYLIWVAQTAYKGQPVFNKASQSLRWLCSNKSPCSGVTPEFPKSAVYYFNVEFSNRVVDNSNCDFTFQFIIKVHGLPPGSIDPSLVIVLVCLGLMVFGLLVGFFIRKHYSHVLRNIQWRQILRLRKDNSDVVSEENATESIELKTEINAGQQLPVQK